MSPRPRRRAHEDLPSLQSRADARLAHRADGLLPPLLLRLEVLPELPLLRSRVQQPMPRAPGGVVPGEVEGELLRVLRVRGEGRDGPRGVRGVADGSVAGALGLRFAVQEVVVISVTPLTRGEARAKCALFRMLFGPPAQVFHRHVLPLTRPGTLR